ncbi:MAG: hypothetical protein KatS3mg010_0332 [Acidimicrobiia bacterium]|nr:MAG: hypothetical protein KatS3mg010_0332 [Acidimicrobiia bacterium]
MRVLPAEGAGDGIQAPVKRGPFVPGDRALLVDSRRRRHLITLAAGGQFHTHAGIVEHDAIIGADEGATVRTSKGARLVRAAADARRVRARDAAGRPGHLPPKDPRPDPHPPPTCFPGARVLESGIGSGALTHCAACAPSGRRAT